MEGLSTVSGNHKPKGRCQTVALPQVKTTSTQENELVMVIYILSVNGVSIHADELLGAAYRASSRTAVNGALRSLLGRSTKKTSLELVSSGLVSVGTLQSSGF